MSRGRRIQDPVERLLARFVVAPSGCWQWTGRLDRHGYGRFWFKGKQRAAHRVMHEIVHARPIPDGLCIDHLCRNRACINPKHMDVTTAEENVARCAVCRCGTCARCQRNAYMRRWSRARKVAQA